jgi:hypothetical protein
MVLGMARFEVLFPKKISPMKKQLYADFIKKWHCLSVFHQPAYLDTMASPANWHPLLYHGASGEVQAVWPLTFTTRWGIRIIRNPPLTPWLGPLIRYPEGATSLQRYQLECKVYKHFAETVPNVPFFRQRFAPEVRNGLPFQWAGFEQQVRYTFRLDLNHPIEVLWQGLKPTLRNRIRKGQQRLQLQEGGDWAQLYRDLQATLARQGQSLGVGREKWEALSGYLHQASAGQLHAAVDEKGEVVAQVLLVWDNSVSYALVIASKGGAASTSYTMPALLWHCILWSKAKGLRIFDFEGSMLPGPARFFATFGAYMQPYYQFTKYKNRLWEALALFRKP